MSDEKLTAVEQAAEKARKADLAADLARKDPTELKLLAQQIGVVDADKIEKPEDLKAAIELKAEADAAAGRQRIRDMEAEEAESVGDEDANRPSTSRIIRALNAEFCRDIPQEGRHGSFEPDGDDPRFGGDYDVSNGKYRVVGSEWLFLIHRKKLQAVERAGDVNKYGGKYVIAID